VLFRSLAAGLGLVSPMFVMLSGVYLPHGCELALLTWFAWAILRARRLEGRTARRYAWLAGLLGGLALTVRPLTAAAVGLPFAGLAVVDLLRAPRRCWPVYAIALSSFLLAAALWPAYNWIVAGNPLIDTYRLYWAYDTIGFGPQIGRFGHSLQDGLKNVGEDLQVYQEMAMGWPAPWHISTMGLVVLAALALPRRSRWEGFLLLPAAALFLAQVTYWARSAGLFGPRYFAEAMPFTWLLAARGLLKLDHRCIRASARWTVRGLLAVWMLWSLAALVYPHFEQGRNLYNISRDDARVIAGSHLENALVFVEAHNWTDYARLSWLNAVEVWHSPVVFARNHGADSNQQVRNLFPDRQVYRFDHTARPPLAACPDPCELFPPVSARPSLDQTN
jgi:hypothetical protein